MAEKGESALKSPGDHSGKAKPLELKVEQGDHSGKAKPLELKVEQGDHSGKAKPLELKVEQGDSGKVKVHHPFKIKLEQGDSSEVKPLHPLKVKLEQGDSSEVKALHPLKVKLEQGDSGKAKATHPLRLKLEQDSIKLYCSDHLPENTTCVMDCEAVDIMKRYQERMLTFSIQPPASFDSGLEYAQSNKLYDNPLTVKQILEPLKQHGVSDAELCLIANLRLESVDEVLALVPSLKTKKSKVIVPLENVLAELAKLRRAA